VIVNSASYTAEAFVSAIACTIGRDQHCRVDAEALTPGWIASRGGVIYLANGYWRGIPTWSDTGKLVGLTLENPDHTWAERQAVERGIAILIRCEFL
jgi:hypothetical protein